MFKIWVSFFIIAVSFGIIKLNGLLKVSNKIINAIIEITKTIVTKTIFNLIIWVRINSLK